MPTATKEDATGPLVPVLFGVTFGYRLDWLQLGCPFSADNSYVILTLTPGAPGGIMMHNYGKPYIQHKPQTAFW